MFFPNFSQFWPHFHNGEKKTAKWCMDISFVYAKALVKYSQFKVSKKEILFWKKKFLISLNMSFISESSAIS